MNFRDMPVYDGGPRINISSPMYITDKKCWIVNYDVGMPPDVCSQFYCGRPATIFYQVTSMNRSEFSHYILGFCDSRDCSGNYRASKQYPSWDRISYEEILLNQVHDS